MLLYNHLDPPLHALSKPGEGKRLPGLESDLPPNWR